MKFSYSKLWKIFLIVKRQFGYARVAYRGIAKNMNRFHILFASANLVKCFRAGRTKEFCMVKCALFRRDPIPGKDSGALRQFQLTYSGQQTSIAIEKI